MDDTGEHHHCTVSTQKKAESSLRLAVWAGGDVALLSQHRAGAGIES